MKASILFRRGWIALIFIVFLPFSAKQTKAQSPWPADSGTEIASGIASLLPNFEASGLIYHPLLDQLLVVSDDGQVCKMDLDGSHVTCFNLGALDLEGIALSSEDSPFAYLALEFPYRILELDLANEQLSGNFWDVPGMSGPVNAGIEAIAFVPNGSHPYMDSNSGGLFYLGLQDTGDIFVYDVDLSQSGHITLIDQFTPVIGRSDLADLFFHEERGILFALYDSANILTEMQSDGSILREYFAAGNDQEGILLIGNCNQSTGTLYIAEDSGPGSGPHVLAFSGYPLNCPPTDDDDDDDDNGNSIEEGSDDDSGDSAEEKTEREEKESDEPGENSSASSGGCSLILRDDKANPSKWYKPDTIVPRK